MKFIVLVCSKEIKHLNSTVYFKLVVKSIFVLFEFGLDWIMCNQKVKFHQWSKQITDCACVKCFWEPENLIKKCQVQAEIGFFLIKFSHKSEITRFEWKLKNTSNITISDWIMRKLIRVQFRQSNWKDYHFHFALHRSTFHRRWSYFSVDGNGFTFSFIKIE